MTSKALLPVEFFSGAHAAWLCDTPSTAGKHGRSALIWSSAERNASPKLQLASPDEPGYRIERGPSESSTNYMHIDAQPGNDNQRQVLGALDRYAIQQAEHNCKQWFGKSLSVDQLQSMYRPLLEESGFVRLRFSRASCNVWCVQNGGYVPGTPSDLECGGRIMPCVTLNGIYFKAREMGLSLTCSDMLVFPVACFPFHVPASLLRPTPVCLPEHEDPLTPLATSEMDSCEEELRG